MKETIKKYIETIRSRPKTSGAVLLILAVVFFAMRGGNTKVEQVSVVKGDVIEEVAVTGKTVAVKDLSLGFDRGGKVASAPVSVGDRVIEGQIIASLDASELLANRAKAAAAVSEAQVALSKSRRTSSDSFSDARANVIARVKDSYATADDVLRNSVDQFFKNPRKSTTYIQFSFKDGATEYNFPIDNTISLEISSERYALEQLLVSWNASLQNIDTAGDVTPYIISAETNLSRIKKFLNSVAYVANGVQASEFQYQATIDGYKQTISSARTDIGTASNNLLTAKEKLSSAPTQTAVNGNSYDEVATAEAKLASAQADLASIDAQINKTIIRSPIAGLITKQDAKVGEIVTAGTALIGVISDKNLEIEANVSEVNIGKLSQNNVAEFSFDAFPGKLYTGKVFYIEPAETIVDNVVNYKIKVSIDGDTEFLKSGLTANVHIKTREKLQVLKVPLYAVTQDVQGSTVQKVVDEEKIETVPVTLGLIGNDGTVEIVNGLTEGDVLKVTVTAQ